MKTACQFKDARFMAAAEKRRVLGHWVKFLDSGFDARHFTRSLYDHLISHASFVAHFNRGGFHEVYFQNPLATQRFLDQFDRGKGCRSAEYGDAGWIDAEDYRDINGAMVDEASARLPGLRRLVRDREIARARQELARAEESLKHLLAEGGSRRHDTTGREPKARSEAKRANRIVVAIADGRITAVMSSDPRAKVTVFDFDHQITEARRADGSRTQAAAMATAEDEFAALTKGLVSAY